MGVLIPLLLLDSHYLPQRKHVIRALRLHVRIDHWLLVMLNLGISNLKSVEQCTMRVLTAMCSVCAGLSQSTNIIPDNMRPETIDCRRAEKNRDSLS